MAKIIRLTLIIVTVLLLLVGLPGGLAAVVLFCFRRNWRKASFELV